MMDLRDDECKHGLPVESCSTCKKPYTPPKIKVEGDHIEITGY